MISTRLMVVADVSALGMNDPYVLVYIFSISSNARLTAQFLLRLLSDCITLAALASKAVDFNKSGTPVSIDSLPRPRTSYRPDFNARETDVAQAKLGTDYYESRNILGQLFRSVEVPKPPLMETRQHPRWTPQQPSKPSSEHESTPSPSSSFPKTNLHRTLERFLLSLPRVGGLFTSHPFKTSSVKICSHFINELASIAAFHTLTRRSGEKLSEGEVFIGSIMAATSQPAVRRQ